MSIKKTAHKTGSDPALLSEIAEQYIPSVMTEQYIPKESFDLREIKPEAIISYWGNVAHATRCDGLVVLEVIRKRLLDPFSLALFQALLESTEFEDLQRVAQQIKKDELRRESVRLEVIRLTLICMGGETSLLTSGFKRLFSDISIDMENLVNSPPSTPWFDKDAKVEQWLREGLYLAHCASQEGLVGIFRLVDLRENVKNRLLYKGLSQVVDGMERKVLDQIVKAQQKALLQELATKMDMFIHICLGMFRGRNPHILAIELGYYIPGIWDPDSKDEL